MLYNSRVSNLVENRNIQIYNNNETEKDEEEGGGGKEMMIIKNCNVKETYSTTFLFLNKVALDMSSSNILRFLLEVGVARVSYVCNFCSGVAV